MLIHILLNTVCVCVCVALLPPPLDSLKRMRLDVYDGKIAIQLDVKYDKRTAPKLVKDAISVSDTKDGRGRGCYASQKIPKGTYLGEYVGEEIDREEFFRRYAKSSSSNELPPRYVLRVDSDLYIDAERYATSVNNFTPALMNHADDGDVNVVRYCAQRRNPALIHFFAKKDIYPGSELVFDYGSRYWNGREHEKKQASNKATNERNKVDLLDTQFFDPDNREDEGPILNFLKASFRKDPQQFESLYVAIVLSSHVFFAQLLVRWYKYNIWLGGSATHHGDTSAALADMLNAATSTSATVLTDSIF